MPDDLHRVEIVKGLEPGEKIVVRGDLASNELRLEVADDFRGRQQAGGPDLYLVECPALFGRKGVYGNAPDEHLRFLALTPITDEAVPVAWDRGRTVDLLVDDLEKAAASGATFAALLAGRLERYRSSHPMVLGLSRGGVPVALEVARGLPCALTLASGSIIIPSVRLTPISSGRSSFHKPAWSSKLGHAG